MKAVIHEYHAELFPTDFEVKHLCRPGCGSDTCVWLVVGIDGFECAYFNRPLGLVEKVNAGTMTAKRDGCDKVGQWSPSGQPLGEVEF